MTEILYCMKNMPGHFTKGKTYNAIYEMDTKDQGWYVIYDSKAQHWLSRWDGKNHTDIFQEPFVRQYFIVISK